MRRKFVIEELIGKKFNKLTVIGKSKKKKFVKVKCDCGKLKSVNIYKVLTNDTRSCGCIRFSNRLIDLSGQRFGRLVVTNTFIKTRSDGLRTSFSNCLCDCGKITSVSSGSLRQGGSKSCGCLKAEKVADGSLRATHRKINHYLYCTWRKIKERCYNPNTPNFDCYGGRVGNPVFMHEDWKNSFQCFYDDIMSTIGEKPTPEHSIDRIDVLKSYVPGNLRWATNSEQQRNKVNTIYLTYKGVTLSLADWADRIGVLYGTLSRRYHVRHLYPMTDEQIITTPVRKNSKHDTIIPNLDWLIGYSQPRN